MAAMPMQTSRAHQSLWLLWIGILAGPVAWACDEVIGYSATAHECSTGHMFLLHLLTIGALIVCAIGFLSAWRALQNVTGIGEPVNARGEGPALAMAISGMLLSSSFAIVIIATAIPKWMLSACD